VPGCLQRRLARKWKRAVAKGDEGWLPASFPAPISSTLCYLAAGHCTQGRASSLVPRERPVCCNAPGMHAHARASVVRKSATSPGELTQEPIGLRHHAGQKWRDKRPQAAAVGRTCARCTSDLRRCPSPRPASPHDARRCPGLQQPAPQHPSAPAPTRTALSCRAGVSPVQAQVPHALCRLA
jgi:hypothetical protein